MGARGMPTPVSKPVRRACLRKQARGEEAVLVGRLIVVVAELLRLAERARDPRRSRALRFLASGEAHNLFLDPHNTRMRKHLIVDGEHPEAHGQIRDLVNLRASQESQPHRRFRG